MRDNLVIEFCRALIFLLHLFSKLAHSFVAIELLAFLIMQIFIFIAPESSQYLSFENKIRT